MDHLKTKLIRETKQKQENHTLQMSPDKNNQQQEEESKTRFNNESNIVVLD